MDRFETESGYTVFPEFVFRVPTLPLFNLEEDNWLGNINSNVFREAIFLASPDFSNEINKYINELQDSKNLKLKLSLLKYFLRMSSRCTPFGLFAGCGTGHIGKENSIVLSSIDKNKSCTRLDMDFICSLINKISEQDQIREQVMFSPNSSLNELSNEYRYVEYKYINNKKKHFLTSLHKDPYLSSVLEKSQNQLLISKLTDRLVGDDISFDEAQEYIIELIDNQVLVSELDPTVIGGDLFTQLISKIEKLKNTGELVDQLKNIQYELEKIDTSPIGRDVSIYQSLHAKIEKLDSPFEKKHLFQSDLFVDTEKAQLTEDIASKVLEGIKVLNKLTPHTENIYIRQFKEDFYKRYENEEIPLVNSLDTEIGIRFGNRDNTIGGTDPLINDLPLYNQQNFSGEVTISTVLLFLQKKYEEFISDPTIKVIQLQEDELKLLPSTWTDLPDTLACIIEIYSAQSEASQISITPIGGSSAANLLGRFCHINENIQNLVTDIAQTEQNLNKDIILAEIVHLPESRVGNILYRPPLRDYEIPYLAHSSENAISININDIMISVPNGERIKLTSKKLNKEIIPRLTTAHNFSHNSLPIYEFLCNIQTQNLRTNLHFYWGPLLSKRDYLPRVTYKDLILSPAKWNIAYKELNIPHKDNPDLMKEINIFKSKRNLPDKVLLVAGDNKLPIDLNHKLSVQLLLEEVRNGRPFTLEESLFTEKDALIKRENASFANQIIMCFHKR